ncbi:hypothetical protein SISNIDRAFT_469327 [Sistotremastrum niveocremeum HHB9708]|uniref:Uncharacterized protein n=1 Tax=Sistotremastrum niveocremeum HHB9708 TaxID=1314777 RepID=A0A164QDU1_9AGAM|nr:hypothetical protein SISNIDRAFT_469327 [Sistotremastrum niveocremeum HHB9708]
MLEWKPDWDPGSRLQVKSLIVKQLTMTQNPSVAIPILGKGMVARLARRSYECWIAPAVHFEQTFRFRNASLWIQFGVYLRDPWDGRAAVPQQECGSMGVPSVSVPPSQEPPVHAPMAGSSQAQLSSGVNQMAASVHTGFSVAEDSYNDLLAYGQTLNRLKQNLESVGGRMQAGFQALQTTAVEAVPAAPYPAPLDEREDNKKSKYLQYLFLQREADRGLELEHKAIHQSLLKELEEQKRVTAGVLARLSALEAERSLVGPRILDQKKPKNTKRKKDSWRSYDAPPEKKSKQSES